MDFVYLVTYKSNGERLCDDEVYTDFVDAMQEAGSLGDEMDATIVQVALDPVRLEAGREAVKRSLTAAFQVCVGCRETLPAEEFEGSPVEGLCCGCAMEGGE